MTRVLSLLFVACVVAALHGDARACSFAAHPPHVVDPSMQATDQTPPALPPLPAPRIGRGMGQSGCEGAASSCDDLGTITLPARATDDVTPPDSIGYRLTLENGTLPAGLTLPTDAIRPVADVLVLIWIDGATDNQESFGFTLQVVAIDLAGNESAPRSVMVVSDPGHACAIAPGRAPRAGVACIVLIALLAAGRRQRRATRR